MAGISDIFNVQWLSTPAGLELAVLFDDRLHSEEVFFSWLTPGEKKAVALKTSGSARRSWLLGRLAAKLAAARRWATEPARVEVTRGFGGRPELTAPSEGGVRHVSISHTVGAAASVVGAEAVGIDLERADRVLNERAVDKVFSLSELELLESVQNFPGTLSLWCAREAAAKSWGLGLLDHLPHVRVSEADWLLGCLTVDWLGEAPSRRAFVRLKTAGNYLVALATDFEF